MVREKTIKSNCYKVLEGEGYYCWAPARGGYMNQSQDVFGIFDVLAIKGTHVRWIQFTSKGNMSARRKKILSFFKKHSCFIESELWGYDDNKREFKVEKFSTGSFTN